MTDDMARALTEEIRDLRAEMIQMRGTMIELASRLTHIETTCAIRQSQVERERETLRSWIAIAIAGAGALVAVVSALWSIYRSR